MKWLKIRKYVIDVKGHIHVLNNVVSFVHVCKVASVRVSLSQSQHLFPLMKILSRVCLSDVPLITCISICLQCVQNTPPGSRELRYCHWQHLVNTKEVEMLFGLNKTSY